MVNADPPENSQESGDFENRIETTKQSRIC